MGVGWDKGWEASRPSRQPVSAKRMASGKAQSSLEVLLYLPWVEPDLLKALGSMTWPCAQNKALPWTISASTKVFLAKISFMPSLAFLAQEASSEAFPHKRRVAEAKAPPSGRQPHSQSLQLGALATVAMEI